MGVAEVAPLTSRIVSTTACMARHRNASMRRPTQAGVGILFVSHNLAVVRYMAQTVAVACQIKAAGSSTPTTRYPRNSSSISAGGACPPTPAESQNV